MTVSDRLAVSIHTIVTFHIVAILLVFGFSFYIYLRAKKTPLLYSYLAVVIRVLAWMVSKVLKTVSPTEAWQWFFVVTQYLAVQYLGYSFLLFAFIYTRNKKPSRKSRFLLSIPPTLAFLIVLTNPLHMGFYSSYDFYRASVGPLFPPTQLIIYIYLFIAILLLSKGYTNQPGFQGKKGWARFSAFVVVLPLIFNVYYGLFKVIKPMRWILPFSTFDFTPIAISISLIIFMIPALRYRFFDISPVSYKQLFDQIPHGIVFMNTRRILYAKNRSFLTMFDKLKHIHQMDTFIQELPFENPQDRSLLIELMNNTEPSLSFDMHLKNRKSYKITRTEVSRGNNLIRFIDISFLVHSRRLIESKNEAYTQLHAKLDGLARTTRELAVTRTKTWVSQNMHDILGHSLTVVIGTAELAMRDTDHDQVVRKLVQIDELLSSSLQDLNNTITGKSADWEQSSLTKAIQLLQNDNIQLDFTIQGQIYELNSKRTEAVFRLCQEAVTNAIKHGRASTIHIILRYKENELEVFAIDDGVGCTQINKHYGLSGIERRLADFHGNATFASNGERGFTIHAFIPRYDTP